MLADESKVRMRKSRGLDRRFVIFSIGAMEIT